MNRQDVAAERTRLIRVALVIGIGCLCALPANVFAQCPADMAFVPGGLTTVVYSGERWGGTVEETETVDDFCIDVYEASQPDATAESMGSWDGISAVPAAQSVAGVLPWVTISWDNAKLACAASGKRLATLAEWQTAYSGYDGAAWPWGSDAYDPDLAATCWINVATAPPFAYPTGGCCYENCDGGSCFTVCDMLGNIAESVDGYWDEECYGQDQVLCAGAGIVSWDSTNYQEEDPEKPGCWKFVTFAQRRFGLHHHLPTDAWLQDDGFRCAKSPEDDDDTSDDDTADDDAADDDTSDDDGADDDADDDGATDDDGTDDDSDDDDDDLTDDDPCADADDCNCDEGCGC